MTSSRAKCLKLADNICLTHQIFQDATSCLCVCSYRLLCGPVNSVGIATISWTVRGPNPGGTRFPPVQTSSGAHPASCTMGTGSFPGVKYGRGMLLTTHPLLVPQSWKSRAIFLPNLWTTTRPITGALYLFTLLVTDLTKMVNILIFRLKKSIFFYFSALNTEACGFFETSRIAFPKKHSSQFHKI